MCRERKRKMKFYDANCIQISSYKTKAKVNQNKRKKNLIHSYEFIVRTLSWNFFFSIRAADLSSAFCKLKKKTHTKLMQMKEKNGKWKMETVFGSSSFPCVVIKQYIVYDWRWILLNEYELTNEHWIQLGLSNLHNKCHFPCPKFPLWIIFTFWFKHTLWWAGSYWNCT